MSSSQTETGSKEDKAKLKRSKRIEQQRLLFNRQLGRIKKVFICMYPELDKFINSSSFQRLETALRRKLTYKGVPGYVSFTKVLFLWTFQYFGESITRNPTHYIAINRRGVPKVLAPVVFDIETSVDRKKEKIQFLMTVCSIYRSYLGSGKLKLDAIRVIVDDNNAINARLQSDLLLQNRVKRAARLYFDTNDRSAGADVLRGPSLFTSSSGPSSHTGEVPLSEFPIWDPVKKELVRPTVKLSLSALLCAELEALALASNSEAYKSWVQWCTVSDQMDLIALHKECLMKCKGKDKVYPIGRLGFKSDKGLKNRPYAMVNYWIQLSLGGIHTWAYSVLRLDKANRCFDHRDAFTTAVNRVKQNPNCLVGCLDETAATDKFPLTPFSWCLEVRFGSDISSAWTSLMQNLKFNVDRYKPIQWGCGQPLGTKGSWPLYNIVSEVVDLVPVSDVSTNLYNAELRVGDDTVFYGKYWIDTLRRWREEFFGVSYGDKVGCISKTAVEFCKQFYTKYGEVTPLPASLIEKAFFDSASFGMLVTRLHETCDIPYSSEVFRQLATVCATFWSSKRNRLTMNRTRLSNTIGIVMFLGSNTEDYRKVVRLLALHSIKDALVETENFRTIEQTFASRVFKALKAKSLANFRVKAQEILTDPNPILDWEVYRRVSVFRPSWLKHKEIQRRGFSNLVDFVTMSDKEMTKYVETLTNDIFKKTGY